MEALVQLIKTLGYSGSLIVVCIFLISVLLPGFSFGEKVKFSGLISIFKKKQTEATVEQPDQVNEDYYCHIKHNEELIGFEIPKPKVYIFGQTWNSKDDECVKLYSRLDEKWDQCDSVDITQANITSSLVSLLVDKAEKFPKLRVYHKQDQTVLLNVLTKYSNVELEAR